MAAAVGLGGCYRYVPSDLGTVPEGEDVRVYLSREGMTALPELLGDGQPVLSGTLVRREPDLVLLRVPVASRREGFHTAAIGQNIRIPAAEVVQLERRELDRLGTGLLLASGAASVAAVIFLIMDDAGGRRTTSPPQPPEIRVPVLAFPVP